MEGEFTHESKQNIKTNITLTADYIQQPLKKN